MVQQVLSKQSGSACGFRNQRTGVVTRTLLSWSVITSGVCFHGVANVACVLLRLLGIVNQAATAVRTRSFRKTATVANCFFLAARSRLPCCLPVSFCFPLLIRLSAHTVLCSVSGYWLWRVVTPAWWYLDTGTKTGNLLCRLAVPFCFPLLRCASGILVAVRAFALPGCLPLCVCVSAAVPCGINLLARVQADQEIVAQ